MDWNQNHDYQPDGFESGQQQNAGASAQNEQTTQDSFFFAPPPKKNASYYRARAREALKGNYWMAVLAALCFTAILGVALWFAMAIGIIPMIFSMSQSAINGQIPTDHAELISTMLWAYAIMIVMALTVTIFGGGPLTVGYYRLHLDPIDGKKIHFATLFSGFSKKYWNSVGTYAFMLLPQLAVMLIYCVLCIPVLFVVTRLSMYFVNEPLTLLPIMLGIYLVLFAVVLILQVVITYRFKMALYIIAEYPEMRPVDAMRNSMALMKGKCWKLFRLQLSFIGWYLLLIPATLFTCGLGAYVLPFMLMPYPLMAEVAFYDDIANRKAADETEFPSLDPGDYDPEQAKW